MKPLNENSGLLFRNDRRENDRQPTHTGKLVISRDLMDAIWEGKELRLAAWVKEGKNGRFFSLQISGPSEAE